MLGVAPSVVRHMVQAELLPSETSKFPSGRQARTVQVGEIDRMAEMVRSAVSLREASRQLALPERRIRELIHNGVITPMISRAIVPAAAAWSIPAREVERLMVKSATAGALPSITVRDFVRYGRLGSDEVACLARMVLRGELVCAAGVNQLSPLGTVSLDRRASQSWLKELRDARRTDMSVDVAASSLGVKQQVAYALIKAGLLLSRKDAAGHRRVRNDDIREFQKLYVPLAEVAQRTGTSPRSLLARIKATPVTGPKIDASRQYFYRRADLIEPIDTVALWIRELP